MQGQRGVIGSLPETLEFNHGSTSANPITEQQICWNILPNPAENRLADSIVPPSQITNAHTDSIDQERQNLTRWSLGPPTFTGAPNEPICEEHNTTLSLDYPNSQFAQNSNSNATSQNPGSNSASSGSLEGRRRSCKRKAVEGHIGQSSTSERHGFLQCPEYNPFPGSSLRISSPLEQAYPEALQRNLRLRINSSNQYSIPPPSFSAANSIPQHSSRLLPAVHSVDFRSPPVLIGATSQGEPLNVQPFRWSEGSSSRNASSSSASRNLWDNPVFMNSAVRSVEAGSSSSVHPFSGPAQATSSRRLAEYVRQSLFSSGNAEFGGQSSNQPLHSGPPGLSKAAIASSGVPNVGHQRSFPRPAGFPYPLRTLAASEGRSRLLVSEIRNVLNMMRRGESLRFEDMMILEQSAFFGVPDRHRDMRLDVDNMSYEELLALEERIGNVNTGLSEETISKHLKQTRYSASLKNEADTEPCCICREEYNDGENIGTLDCGHDYHRDCIKQWLMLKNWCPICKTTGLAT